MIRKAKGERVVAWTDCSQLCLSEYLPGFSHDDFQPLCISRV